MPDNTDLPVAAGKVADDEVTYSGDTAKVQLNRPVHVTGAEGSRTVVEITSADGVLVNLGANNDVTVTSLPAIPAGTNNIGDVDVLTLPALPAGTNNIGDVDVLTLPALAAGSAVIGQTYGSFVTCSTQVTRPADTTAYAANDALSNSTSAPTAGGYTFTNAARVSGGSGIITDCVITTDADAATLLQGELLIFDQAVTNINDNAAYAITDAEARTCIGKIPFTLEDMGNQGWYHAQNLSIGYTCVGTANLRFLVRVKNAYVPVSGEVINFIIKCVRVD